LRDLRVFLDATYAAARTAVSAKMPMVANGNSGTPLACPGLLAVDCWVEELLVVLDTEVDCVLDD